MPEETPKERIQWHIRNEGLDYWLRKWFRTDGQTRVHYRGVKDALGNLDL